MIGGYWRRRAQALEAQLADANKRLNEAREHLAGLEARIADNATLISMTREGRTLRLMFVRNGELTIIETYITMDLQFEELQRALLHRQETE